MHENLRNAFSVKPEYNQLDGTWQHIRTERKSLTLFSLYSKMNFVNATENLAELKNYSFLTQQFKKGLQIFGIQSITEKIDLFYDLALFSPVYYIKIVISGTDGTETIAQDVSLLERPSILNCVEEKYTANFKQDLEKHLNSDDNRKMKLNYPLYFDIEYVNSPVEEEDDSINFLDFFYSTNGIVGTNSVFGAKIDLAKGTIATVKCRPIYVQLLS